MATSNTGDFILVCRQGGYLAEGPTEPRPNITQDRSKAQRFDNEDAAFLVALVLNTRPGSNLSFDTGRFDGRMAQWQAARLGQRAEIIRALLLDPKNWEEVNQQVRAIASAFGITKISLGYGSTYDEPVIITSTKDALSGEGEGMNVWVYPEGNSYSDPPRPKYFFSLNIKRQP